MNDRALLQQCKQDISYFEQLVERYERQLRAYILRISSVPTAEAEELLQEVFVKVWKHINSYDEQFAVSTWLYRITRNHVISHARKHRHDALSLDDGGYEWIPADAPAVWEELELAYKKEHVRKALDHLPIKYKEVIVLRYLENKSYEEIGDILKKPAGTVATLLNRAKVKLRHIYDTLPQRND